MRIFAIGDLHLSGSGNKPMNVFGAAWDAHEKRLIEHWMQSVQEEDLVLIPGDISWGMRIDEAELDLKRLERLPGQKICIKGNHDYWWDRPGKLNARYQRMYFLQNTCYFASEYAICGSRGWTCPSSPGFSEEDTRILNRELIRLRLSLAEAVKRSDKPIIVMMHYPPADINNKESPFTNLFEDYPIRHVVYGHLHDEGSWQEALQGDYKGIQYHLVSADYLKFIPLRIR